MTHSQTGSATLCVSEIDLSSLAKLIFYVPSSRRLQNRFQKLLLQSRSKSSSIRIDLLRLAHTHRVRISKTLDGSECERARKRITINSNRLNPCPSYDLVNVSLSSGAMLGPIKLRTLSSSRMVSVIKSAHSLAHQCKK